MIQRTLGLLTFALVASAAAPALAQSYGSLGNDPVRSHTHLGDRQIDTSQGGTLCAKTKRGVTCRPASAYSKATKTRH